MTLNWKSFGSGSGFGFGSGSRESFFYSFSTTTTKNGTKYCLFNVRSSIISQKLSLLVLIFNFFIPFYVGYGSKSGSGTAKAKRYGSFGTGSTTLDKRLC
jgi:hypothetical protein